MNAHLKIIQASLQHTFLYWPLANIDWARLSLLNFFTVHRLSSLHSNIGKNSGVVIRCWNQKLDLCAMLTPSTAHTFRYFYERSHQTVHKLENVTVKTPQVIFYEN